MLPDNAYLSLGKRLHFRGPTLPVIAVATSEVGPAVLLFIEEACQVLRFQTNSVPRYQLKYPRPKYDFFKCGGTRGHPSYHRLEQCRYPDFSDRDFDGTKQVQHNCAADSFVMNGYVCIPKCRQDGCLVEEYLT